MKAACYFHVFQSLAVQGMRPSLILKLPDLLPGGLQSCLEAVFGFSVLSASCPLSFYHFFTPGDHEEKK